MFFSRDPIGAVNLGLKASPCPIQPPRVALALVFIQKVNESLWVIRDMVAVVIRWYKMCFDV